MHARTVTVSVPLIPNTQVKWFLRPKAQRFKISYLAAVETVIWSNRDGGIR
jgi:hypothetical protein